MTKKQLKQKGNKKWFFWLLLLVLLVAAGAGTYLVWDLYTKNHETATKVEQKTNETEESDTVTAGGSTVIVEEDEATGKKKVKQYEGEDPNEMADLSGVMTSAYQDAGNLVILTSIDQFLNGGSCELNLQQNGQTIYTGTEEIVADVSTSYCDAFEVPLAGLGAGNYQIVINLSSGEKTGVINGEANL